MEFSTLGQRAGIWVGGAIDGPLGVTADAEFGLGRCWLGRREIHDDEGNNGCSGGDTSGPADGFPDDGGWRGFLRMAQAALVFSTQWWAENVLKCGFQRDAVEILPAGFRVIFEPVGELGELLFR